MDPQLLFQRLSLITTNGLKDELCTHLPALVNSSSLPWEADKPALVDALWKLFDNENEVVPDSVHYVIDGVVSLLQRVPRTKGETFNIVCERYVSYVRNKYGKPKIVFDGK